LDCVLELKNIKKLYKNNRGVNDISLKINKGNVYGLLGENGSGKTTIMKIITGLINKYEGECLFMGQNIKDNFEESIYHMGALIENPAFYDYMSPLENLKLIAKYYTKEEITLDDIHQKLKLVNLFEVKNDKLKNFSFGMKQRMGLAMAMINNPSFYILDEPSNGLDIKGIMEIREILLNITRTGQATVLISSHQASEIEKLCTHVGIINQGELKNSSSREEILENYPSVEDYFVAKVGR